MLINLCTSKITVSHAMVRQCDEETTDLCNYSSTYHTQHGDHRHVIQMQAK